MARRAAAKQRERSRARLPAAVALSDAAVGRSRRQHRAELMPARSVAGLSMYSAPVAVKAYEANVRLAARSAMVVLDAVVAEAAALFVAVEALEAGHLATAALDAVAAVVRRGAFALGVVVVVVVVVQVAFLARAALDVVVGLRAVVPDAAGAAAATVPWAVVVVEVAVERAGPVVVVPSFPLRSEMVPAREY
jgi:hypothetical protein